MLKIDRHPDSQKLAKCVYNCDVTSERQVTKARGRYQLREADQGLGILPRSGSGQRAKVRARVPYQGQGQGTWPRSGYLTKVRVRAAGQGQGTLPRSGSGQLAKDRVWAPCHG